MNRLQKFINHKILGIQDMSAKNFTNVPNNQYVQAIHAFLNGQFAHKEYEDKIIIEDAYQFNSDFYSIVNYLVTCFSAIDFKLMKQVGDEVEEITNHPILDLLYNPNPTQGKALLLEQDLLYKYLTGQSYMYGIGPDSGQRRGTPTELWILPAHKVSIVSGGPMMPIKEYKVDAMEIEYIPSENVRLWKYASPHIDEDYDLYGQSPAKAAWRVIQKTNDALTAEIAMFENGGPATIVSRNPNQNAQFSQEQAQALEKSNRLKYGGAHNKNKWAFTAAQLEVHQLGLSPADLALTEAQKAAFRQMCRVFKIAPEILGDPEAKTYNNVLEAKKSLYTDNLLPEFRSLCDELNRWLIPKFKEEGLYLVPDTSNIEVLQKDKKQMSEWLATAYWIKGTDKQRMMGVEEDPRMDGYFNSQGIRIDREADTLSTEIEKFYKNQELKDYV